MTKKLTFPETNRGLTVQPALWHTYLIYDSCCFNMTWFPIRRLAQTFLFVFSMSSFPGYAEGLDMSPGVQISGAGVAQTELCHDAIRKAEGQVALPPQLLDAIGIVESGRMDPVTHQVSPWPWTINVNGQGHYFSTKNEAVAAVEAARRDHNQSVDVGCLQINLFYHPSAFPTLEDAFDPRTNALVAASFLRSLYAQLGDWPHAAAAYHSETPERGADYLRHIASAWPLASRFGITSVMTAAPARPAQPTIDPLDPYGVLTSSFRAELQRQVLPRLRWAATDVIPSAAHLRIAEDPLTLGNERGATAQTPRHLPRPLSRQRD